MKKAIYFVIVVSGILTLFGLCLQWDSGSVGSGPYISEAVASSPGDVGDGDGDTSRESSQSDDEFHAWLEHPEHVFEANLMQLRVRLFPNTNEFPGMRKADVNRFDDTVVQATIALGGPLGAVMEHTDRQPSAVASPAREGAGSGGTRILPACDFECVGAAGGRTAV